MSASWLRAAGSLFYFSRRSNSIRTYATEPPRTFLPTSQSIPEASSTAQSRLYYATHPPARDLPKEEVREPPLKTDCSSENNHSQSKWPVFLAAAVAGVAGWSAFMMVATNQEKLSSSVFRSIVRALKVDPQITETLGDAIRPQAEWYLNGDPHIKGHVSQPLFLLFNQT